jgi:uncharacterized protein with beta-barrel porin domain
VAATGLFAGNIRNSGTISASGFGAAPGALTVTQAQINQAIGDNGGVVNPVIASLLGLVPAGRAVGIQIGATAFNSGAAGPMKGAVVNSGLITATGFGVSTNGNGTTPVSGIGIAANVPVLGGITNLGTIMGSSAAIDLTQETGGSTVVTQAGGLLQGAIKLSGNADQLMLTGGVLDGAVAAPAGNHAVVSVPSGAPTLAAGATINNVSRFTQTGGTLTLQVTSNPNSGFPTVSAGSINLNGTLSVDVQGSLPGFVATPPVFKDLFVSGSPITGVESVTTSNILFGASLSPDATTVNALDLTVAISPPGEALTAQVLAEALRFGLTDQQVVVDTIENRLLVGGNQGPGLQFASARGDRLVMSDADQKAQIPLGGSGAGGQLWGRLYGEAGGAPATGTLPGFGENRIGGLVGADWRFDQFVAGGAFHYAHANALFDDGSKTQLASFQGIAYAGWRSGPAYVTALASGGGNDYRITRDLMPFGLTGVATSSPSGSLFTAFGEAGYGFYWGGATMTPYVNLGYVHQHVGQFTETGAFGAFNVAPAKGESLQTTLGIRASTQIGLGGTTLVPEFRAGWAHEFLDPSQTLTAQLAGTAASPFTVVGTSFGHDSALVGIGVSHEFPPGASFFMDYDGKFTGGFNQNVGSVGIRVRL